MKQVPFAGDASGVEERSDTDAVCGSPGERPTPTGPANPSRSPAISYVSRDTWKRENHIHGVCS